MTGRTAETVRGGMRRARVGFAGATANFLGATTVCNSVTGAADSVADASPPGTLAVTFSGGRLRGAGLGGTVFDTEGLRSTAVDPTWVDVVRGAATGRRSGDAPAWEGLAATVPAADGTSAAADGMSVVSDELPRFTGGLVLTGAARGIGIDRSNATASAGSAAATVSARGRIVPPTGGTIPLSCGLRHTADVPVSTGAACGIGIDRSDATASVAGNMATTVFAGGRAVSSAEETVLVSGGLRDATGTTVLTGASFGIGMERSGAIVSVAGNVSTTISAFPWSAFSAGGTVAAGDRPNVGTDAGSGPPPAVPRTTAMASGPAPPSPFEAGE